MLHMNAFGGARKLQACRTIRALPGDVWRETPVRRESIVLDSRLND
jgi:hypothetical protein